MVNDVDCAGTASFQVRPSTGDKIKAPGERENNNETGGDWKGKADGLKNIGCRKVLRNFAENKGRTQLVPLLMINNCQGVD
jgi:hypothetical protein